MSSIGIASNSALQAGLGAYQEATKNLARSASDLAGNATNSDRTKHSTSLNSTAVELLSNSQLAKASVEVIETAIRQDGIIGSIIDTYA